MTRRSARIGGGVAGAASFQRKWLASIRSADITCYITRRQSGDPDPQHGCKRSFVHWGGAFCSAVSLFHVIYQTTLFSVFASLTTLVSFFHESSFLFTLSPPFFISETCTPDRDSQSQTLISPFFHRVFPLLLSDSGLMLPPSGGESHDSRVRHGKEWREKGEEQMIDKKKQCQVFPFIVRASKV